MDTSLHPTITLLMTGLCAFLFVAVRRGVELRLPLLLVPLALLTVLILYPSDPSSWSLEKVVIYLAVPSLDPLRLLAVTVIGGMLFYGAVYTLYRSRRR